MKDENDLKNLSREPLAFISIWKYLPNHSWSPIYANESINGKRIESDTMWLNAFQYYAVPVRCHQQKYTEKKEEEENQWKCQQKYPYPSVWKIRESAAFIWKF